MSTSYKSEVPEPDPMTVDSANLGSVDPLSVEGLFLVALSKTGTEREAFLNTQCMDSSQRQRVEALLVAYEQAGDFLQKPAVAQEPIPIGQYLAPCELPGTLGRLGPYEILEEIGRGGMGVVFRAHDPKLQRIVAVKALAPELARLPTARQRFLREARAAAAISHPHVVTIFAVEGTEEASLGAERTTLPFLVMECVVGQTLHDKIKRVGALKVEEIVRISRQMAEGLTAAHKRGLIHRDIKPANILLENGVERVKITDFGLARTTSDGGITHTGEILGTPQCMSPEQARGEIVDQRSDLFSLGCVMYTMCTGVSPFRADNMLAVMKKVCEVNPRPVAQMNPNIPEWLCKLVHQLLAKEPERRVQTASDVVQILETQSLQLGITSAQPSPESDSLKPCPNLSHAPALSQCLRWQHWLPVVLLVSGLIGFVVGQNRYSYMMMLPIWSAVAWAVLSWLKLGLKINWSWINWRSAVGSVVGIFAGANLRVWIFAGSPGSNTATAAENFLRENAGVFVLPLAAGIFWLLTRLMPWAFISTRSPAIQGTAARSRSPWSVLGWMLVAFLGVGLFGGLLLAVAVIIRDFQASHTYTEPMDSSRDVLKTHGEKIGKVTVDRQEVRSLETEADASGRPSPTTEQPLAASNPTSKELLAKLQGDWLVTDGFHYVQGGVVQYDDEFELHTRPGSKRSFVIRNAEIWHRVEFDRKETGEPYRMDIPWGHIVLHEEGKSQAIDLVNENDQPPETRGLYKIDGDRLQLAIAVDSETNITKGMPRPKALLPGKDVIYFECERVNASGATSSTPATPGPASSNEILAKLQGAWGIDLDADDDLPTETRGEVTIEGNMLTLWEIVPPQPGLTTEAMRSEAGALLLKPGTAGPPQQIDLVIGPNDGDKRRETQGIIEITGDTVKLCYDPQHTKGEIQRPAAFASGKHADLLVLKRRHEASQVSELEGDWHLVTSFDHNGQQSELRPSNWTIRGDQRSIIWPGGGYDCRIKVNPVGKTVCSYTKEEDGSFFQDYYELKGHQLILRNEPGAVGYQVYERGHVRIPSVVPPATLEQKLLWRSAIVEIVTYGDSHVNNGGENVVGRGVVVSPGGLILAHLAGRWDPPLKDRKVMAKFDDGSQIPLTVVEEGDGLIAFQPEKPINTNHYFKVSQTVVQQHDEVRIWGPDHSQAGSQSLAPYADSVTVLDRKYPALGIAVWQLRFSQHAVLGTPILDADGDLLGITITGTRDLLLAVPVAQLKALFPKSLGQLPAPVPNPSPGAAVPAASPR